MRKIDALDEGAMPNGIRIVKSASPEGDAHPTGPRNHRITEGALIARINPNFGRLIRP